MGKKGPDSTPKPAVFAMDARPCPGRLPVKVSAIVAIASKPAPNSSAAKTFFRNFLSQGRSGLEAKNGGDPGIGAFTVLQS
jgi:hypothetical protein